MVRPTRGRAARSVDAQYDDLDSEAFFAPSLYRAHNAVALLEQFAGDNPLTSGVCHRDDLLAEAMADATLGGAQVAAGYESEPTANYSRIEVFWDDDPGPSDEPAQCPWAVPGPSTAWPQLQSNPPTSREQGREPRGRRHRLDDRQDAARHIPGFLSALRVQDHAIAKGRGGKRSARAARQDTPQERARRLARLGLCGDAEAKAAARTRRPLVVDPRSWDRHVPGSGGGGGGSGSGSGGAPAQRGPEATLEAAFARSFEASLSLAAPPAARLPRHVELSITAVGGDRVRLSTAPSDCIMSTGV